VVIGLFQGGLWRIESDRDERIRGVETVPGMPDAFSRIQLPSRGWCVSGLNTSAFVCLERMSSNEPNG
jgi:hypothetical protein